MGFTEKSDFKGWGERGGCVRKKIEVVLPEKGLLGKLADLMRRGEVIPQCTLWKVVGVEV